MQNISKINTKVLLLLLILPPCLAFGLNLQQPAVLSIFITIIGLWLTETLPLPVTGLLVPVLAALYGVLPASKAFDSFGSDILFLFLGCFLMGRSMEKYSFDKRMAYFLLGKCLPSNSLQSVNFIIALTSFVLSMWISNTAATAILSAITIGILNCLENQIPSENERKNVASRLLLTCAFSASIGGMATPVGSPPNLIALKFLSQYGIEISFFKWLSIALPISLFMMGVMFVVFKFCFPLRKMVFPGIKQEFLGLLSALGPMSRGEKQIAIVFLSAIILWIAPGFLHLFWSDSYLVELLNSRLTMSVVGMGGGLIMFFLPVESNKPNLTWDETSKIDWGTLMLFGGGLTLGVILEQSGAAKEIGSYFFAGDLSKPLILGILLVFASVIMSEFASNTAAASILIPIVLGAATLHKLGVDITTGLVLIVTFGASFGFMLPVSTPPNAIVYGTGKVPASDMRKAGIIFDIAGALLIIFYVKFLFDL